MEGEEVKEGGGERGRGGEEMKEGEEGVIIPSHLCKECALPQMKNHIKGSDCLVVWYSDNSST